jgi:hypothetical protein
VSASDLSPASPLLWIFLTPRNAFASEILNVKKVLSKPLPCDIFANLFGLLSLLRAHPSASFKRLFGGLLATSALDLMRFNLSGLKDFCPFPSLKGNKFLLGHIGSSTLCGDFQSIRKLCKCLSFTLLFSEFKTEFFCLLLALTRHPPGRALQNPQQFCLFVPSSTQSLLQGV